MGVTEHSTGTWDYGTLPVNVVLGEGCFIERSASFDRFRSERDDNGRRYCLIEVDDELVQTLPRAWRPFQGWRYLAPDDAPADRSERGEPPSDHMLAELRVLGLI